MEPTFKCPVCSNRIAFWAVRPEFVCHHCKMILRSNRAEALFRALWVALSIEVLLLLVLFLLFDFSFHTLIVWGSAGGILGCWGGWFVAKHFMVFQPIRRNKVNEGAHDRPYST